MSRFNNLRLAYRLGIAFGATILALVVIGAVAVSKISALDAGTKALTDHDMVTQQHVLNLQADVQRTSYLVTSHLYVHDGELAVQDGVAREIAALTKSGDAELEGLTVSADDAAAKPLIARLEAARASYIADVATAVRRSRVETVRKVEERDGSRNFYARRSSPPPTPSRGDLPGGLADHRVAGLRRRRTRARRRRAAARRSSSPP